MSQKIIRLPVMASNGTIYGHLYLCLDNLIGVEVFGENAKEVIIVTPDKRYRTPADTEEAKALIAYLDSVNIGASPQAALQDGTFRSDTH